MYEKSAKTTSTLSVPKNKVKLDQKLIEISYKKVAPSNLKHACLLSGVTVRIIIADAVIVLFISLQLSWSLYYSLDP